MRALVIVALLLPTVALAQASRVTPLNAEEVRSALIGLTLDGEYQDGQPWRERLNANMTTTYEQGGTAATGRMRFEGNRLCFSYGETFNGGCFEVWRRSFNCFDFYSTDSDGSTGVGGAQQRAGIGWTARAWRADTRSTCVSEKLV